MASIMATSSRSDTTSARCHTERGKVGGGGRSEQSGLVVGTIAAVQQSAFRPIAALGAPMLPLRR